MQKFLALFLCLPFIFSCKEKIEAEPGWHDSKINLNESIQSAKVYGNTAILASETKIYKIDAAENVIYTSPAMGLYFSYSQKYACTFSNKVDFGIDILYHENGGTSFFSKSYADIDPNFSNERQYGVGFQCANDRYFINDSLNEVVTVYSAGYLNKMVINVLKIVKTGNTITDITLSKQYTIPVPPATTYGSDSRGIIYGNGSYYLALNELGLYEINNAYQLKHILNAPVQDIYYKNGVLYAPERHSRMHISLNNGNSWDTYATPWFLNAGSYNPMRDLDGEYFVFSNAGLGQSELFKPPAQFAELENNYGFYGRMGFLFYFNNKYYCPSDATYALQTINKVYY